MFGEPIVVVLYCFFIQLLLFVERIATKLAGFLRLQKFFFKVFFQTRKELATLTRNLVDKEETIRFFFLAESLSYFGFAIRKAQDTKRAVARVKNIVRTIKMQEIALYFLLLPCNFRRNRIVRFPSKDKK